MADFFSERLNSGRDRIKRKKEPLGTEKKGLEYLNYGKSYRETDSGFRCFLKFACAIKIDIY